MKKVIVIIAAVLTTIFILHFFRHQTVTELALSRLGDPYDPGQNGPNSFDSNGFTWWAYHQTGIDLPHGVIPQSHFGPHILDIGKLRRGDLVFFHAYNIYTPSHVGIYLGAGKYGRNTFIASDFLKTNKCYLSQVEEDNINSTYWRHLFLFGVHVSTHYQPIPLYRYYNPHTNDHFYTTNLNRYGQGKQGFYLEKVQCHVYAKKIPGTIPLYRYFNKTTGFHFYTINYNELKTFGDGYTLEKTQCYVYSSQLPGTLPLYRYYEPKDQNHFYTDDYNEEGPGNKDYVIEQFMGYVLP